MTTIYATQPLAFGKVRTYPLASRKSKVAFEDFAQAAEGNFSVTKFLNSLPNILAAADLRNLLASVQRARQGRKAILWGLGGHVIKVGLGPVLAGLMRGGFISGIAMNGAALIHDFEIAIAGSTSEDVEAGIAGGTFGMAAETGEFINEIAAQAVRDDIGYGEAAGRFLNSGRVKTKFAASSVLATAYKLKIPVTVHLAIGTDIPHMHPAADGAALGAASLDRKSVV